jgi:hypothetical protein
VASFETRPACPKALKRDPLNHKLAGRTRVVSFEARPARRGLKSSRLTCGSRKF